MFTLSSDGRKDFRLTKPNPSSSVSSKDVGSSDASSVNRSFLKDRPLPTAPSSSSSWSNNNNSSNSNSSNPPHLRNESDYQPYENRGGGRGRGIDRPYYDSNRLPPPVRRHISIQS